MSGKNITISKEVLERRMRKQYSSYGAKDDSVKTSITQHGTTTSMPRKATPRRYTTKSMLALPRGVATSSSASIDITPSEPAKNNTPLMKKASPSMIPRRLLSTPPRLTSTKLIERSVEQKPARRSSMDEQKLKMIKQLDAFKAALLEEDDVLSNYNEANKLTEMLQSMTTETQSQPQNSNVHYHYHKWTSSPCSTSQIPVPLNRRQEDKCTSQTPVPFNRRQEDKCNNCVTFQDVVPDGISTIHSDESTQSTLSVNTTRSVTTGTYDSDYKSESPLSSSVRSLANTNSTNSSPKIYRSELSINLMPFSTSNMGGTFSVESDQQRIVQDSELFDFEFNDDEMMDEYEAEVSREWLHGSYLYPEIDELNADHTVSDNSDSIFDMVESELAIISKSLDDSTNVIHRILKS